MTEISEQSRLGGKGKREPKTFLGERKKGEVL